MKLETLSHTEEHSKEIADSCKEDSVILLYGELGTGKTTISQYIISDLCNVPIRSVTSPTFNIVHEYFSEKMHCHVFHCDLYRIKSEEELYEMGFMDMMNDGIMIIEWPEIANNLLKLVNKKRIIAIKLTINEHGERFLY